MGLKLHVQIVEARNLFAKDSNGFSDPYVRLQLGSSKAKSAIVYKNLNPTWKEEFFFNIDNPAQDILQLSVWDDDFGPRDDFLGQLSLPVANVLAAENRALNPTWYTLQKRKARSRVSGDILVGLALIGRLDSADSRVFRSDSNSSLRSQESISSPVTPLALPSPASDGPPSPGVVLENEAATEAAPERSFSFTDYLPASPFPQIAAALSRKGSSASSDKAQPPSRLPSNGSTNSGGGESVADSFFEDDSKGVAPPADMPAPLPGGVLVNQLYQISAQGLNRLLFRPGSEFAEEFRKERKATGAKEEPWTRVDKVITRTVTYMTAPSTLIKSVKAIENQVYSRAGDGGYVIHVSTATPDVPYGSSFRTEVQFCIFPGPIDNTTRLRVSWQAKFLQSTVMRPMIERGMSQGLKETYEHYQQLLSRYASPIASDAAVATSPREPPPSLFTVYQERAFLVAAVLASLLLGLMLVHIYLVPPKVGRTGLELPGLDLPDSISELVLTWFVAAVATTLLQQGAFKLRARLLKFGDQGVKPQGEGWLLTVTLKEGEALPRAGAGVAGFSDPYVVFTCNGKTRNSSVKLQTLNPNWDEILEFDAFDDAPSTMMVEVFDYQGPFSEAELLGRAEVNFLKHSAADLSDLWVPLEGRRAKAAGSRLHLRVFLTNSKDGADEKRAPLISEKLAARVASETGRKVLPRSSEKNLAFQRLFSLPDHELLVNDFACAVKKKIPLQGRVFLSPRLLGFYSSIFGHKTSFTILWEDIDELREVSRVLCTPTITVYCKKGRAQDAKEGSYGVDNRGRLKFRFQSFVRPAPAFKTMQVLWRNRTLPEEQQVEKVEEATKLLPGAKEDSGELNGDAFLAVDEPEMIVAAELDLPISLEGFVSTVVNSKLDHKFAEERGLLNYTATEWEPLEGAGPGAFRRQVSYQFPRRICPFGSNVTAMQQRTKSADGSKGRLEEIITLHDVPFGDHFRIQTRREVSRKGPNSVSIRALVGVVFHKRILFQKSISKSVLEHQAKEFKQVADQIIAFVISQNAAGAA